MASSLLEQLSADLEVLSEHLRAGLDEFGTLYCYLEGGRGGRTYLLHAPYQEALPVLQALNGLSFRGRILLALDPSPLSPTLEGLPLSGPTRAPLAHLLEKTRPDRLLLAFPGEGLGQGFPGGKETAGKSDGAAPGWQPLEAEGEPLTLHVEAPTGLVYREVRAYGPWESPPLNLDLPISPGPYWGSVGLALGIPTYGVGLVNLRASLEALFSLW
ncbi:hypothetical protein [Thermus tengchongensis]|uniref:Uncharacterized protein n=2 Tax=Thermus tengchongensis TaxID=1214928 RepID=A0A4Y9EWH6_9DEIN|nr:hypothetical protein [Thermus tengchongensis]TFU16486.1 hypothetical protein E0489_05670 [Thermus tengchongensis]TFU27714.1 hypothetical protein E0687_00580 [Thermus tengchongensis]